MSFEFTDRTSLKALLWAIVSTVCTGVAAQSWFAAGAAFCAIWAINGLIEFQGAATRNMLSKQLNEQKWNK
jgi:hypothetical protein